MRIPCTAHGHVATFDLTDKNFFVGFLFRTWPPLVLPLPRKCPGDKSPAVPIGAPRAPPHSNLHTLSYVSPFSSKTTPHPLQAPQNSQPGDPFYDHEKTARICARFTTHLFACPENPPSSGTSVSPIHGKLHRLCSPPHTTSFCCHLCCSCPLLKARFPTARGLSEHRLFISAFMIASEVICDDTYSWTVVVQATFTLREINQMQREMCGYLD